ncbi:MAG: ATP-binding protein [Oscillospiraceae bacterium]|nr:ATP-binding protein [Oscillospiraceae bacterium]
MAVFTTQGARENIRVKDGKRVFYLADGDHLTPSAAEWLKENDVQILPAKEAVVREYRTLDGGFVRKKPEHMTHLRADVLVRKDHPRIRFRGMIDALEAKLLLAAKEAQPQLRKQLDEILQAVRTLIRCDVMEQPVQIHTVCGLNEQELRQRSHYPQKFYDQPHFMPSADDSRMLLLLNEVRTMIRQTELAAYDAFHDRDGAVTREDILRLLNRLSSMLWILMIQMKKEEQHGS